MLIGLFTINFAQPKDQTSKLKRILTVDAGVGFALRNDRSGTVNLIIP
jgi:hypothetical protein